MCASKTKQEAQNPLMLRCHRLMEAFAKSDDERDFYIDRLEGFLVYADLDKPQAELEALDEELKRQSDRYCLIPKMSFYETKKIMEGFVNEKVYDIDTKEKLLDIIQSKEARENFLEFIYDHHTEQEKWQQFYQERSRVRIIEWLRLNHFHFVFEEDLDFPRHMLEKLKQGLFQAKVGKDILAARKALFAKAKTYYSNEALNPRPKRGRPPKQAAKPDIEPQVTVDIFTTVPPAARPFLFTPDMNASNSSMFSSKFDGEDAANQRQSLNDEVSLTQKLASLRSLSSRWLDNQTPSLSAEKNPYAIDNSFHDDEESDDQEEEEEEDVEVFLEPKKIKQPPKPPAKAPAKVKVKAKKPSKPQKPKAAAKPAKAKAKPAAKRILPKVKVKKVSKAPKAKAKPPLKKILPKKGRSTR